MRLAVQIFLWIVLSICVMLALAKGIAEMDKKYQEDDRREIVEWHLNDTYTYKGHLYYTTGHHSVTVLHHPNCPCRKDKP